MIDLHIPIECADEVSPFVCRVEQYDQSSYGTDGLRLTADGSAGAVGEIQGLEISFPGTAASTMAGDVLLVMPGNGIASRLIRRRSRHNTFLFTEQCDQLCVMCSQPPKRIDDRWRIEHYKKAVRLADEAITLGISGGEPTLQRELFFDFLEDVTSARPDISLHILTNGQHFNEGDAERMRRIHDRAHILWGIPLYAANADLHDRVVMKEGAFERLLSNLYWLASTRGNIELRTVLTSMIYHDLPRLADFVSKNLFFIKVWAIMGLEPTGFAKAFREQLFVDHSTFFEPLEHALDIAATRRVPVSLYNVPLCTVPEDYRGYCSDTISDWKKKYVAACARCERREACAGFFEWYTDKWQYVGVHPLDSLGRPL